MSNAISHPHQNLYDATTALKSPVLLVTKDRHAKSIRKNKRSDIIRCLNRYISKHMAEMVNVQGLGRADESKKARWYFIQAPGHKSAEHRLRSIGGRLGRANGRVS